MSSSEHLFVVAYDIADPKRWRKVFRVMKGYGRWLQLSIFQCRLSARRRAEMAARLDALIAREDDHVVILDLGPADGVEPRVESLGRSFTVAKRQAVVI
jgi:CRISPR-associated protein Cas2